MIKHTKEHIKAFWPYWIVALISIACLAFYVINFWGNDISGDPSDFGVFGDYVGGIINGAVGIISVVFIYKAYVAQSEMNRKQDELLKCQQFESTFFNMLSTQREILNEISVVDCFNETQKGLKAVALIRCDIEQDLEKKLNGSKLLSKEQKLKLKNKVHDVYDEIFKLHASQIGHYFRHLYHILKFVHDGWEKDNDRKVYYDIAQAQMSTDELYLTAINGISVYGRRNLLPLLNDSSFLENLIFDCGDVTVKLIEIFYPDTKNKDFSHEKPNIIFIGGTNENAKEEIAKLLIKDFPILIRVTQKELPIQDEEKRVFSAMVSNTRNFKMAFDKNIDSDKLYLFVGNYCERTKDGDRERISASIFKYMNPALLICVDSINCVGAYDDIWAEDEETHSEDVGSVLNMDVIKAEDEYDYDIIAKRVSVIAEKF